jgi:hypothetical protein
VEFRDELHTLLKELRTRPEVVCVPIDFATDEAMLAALRRVTPTNFVANEDILVSAPGLVSGATISGTLTMYCGSCQEFKESGITCSCATMCACGHVCLERVVKTTGHRCAPTLRRAESILKCVVENCASFPFLKLYDEAGRCVGALEISMAFEHASTLLTELPLLFPADDVAFVVENWDLFKRTLGEIASVVRRLNRSSLPRRHTNNDRRNAMRWSGDVALPNLLRGGARVDENE